MLRFRLSLLLCAACLCACATVTPYQPATDGYGYSEQRLESNRYRISYTASSKTSRETVQDYLTYRAAELTLAQGFDHFLLMAEGVEEPPDSRQPRTGVSIGFGSGSGGSGFGLGIGTRIGDGGASRYAQAEVLMFKGEKPDDRRQALDAREVLGNLRDRLNRPG